MRRTIAPEVQALHHACEIGHIQEVLALLHRRGVPVNAPDAFGNTPLVTATGKGQYFVVVILLKHGADVDERDKRGFTPLFIAAKVGCVEVVAELLRFNADVNLPGAEGMTPLHVAAFNGHLDVVAQLIKNSATVDVLDVNGATPLIFAAVQGHVSVVAELLQNHAKVNTADAYGTSPLHIAAQVGCVEVVALLLKKNANVDIVGANGMTPLYIAAQNGHLEVVILLLQSGARVDRAVATGATSLSIAAQTGHVEVVAELLRNNARIDAAAKNGVTPLYLVAENGQARVVELLLQNNANVNVAEATGATPLYIAAENGHVDVVVLLLRCNVNVDAENADGMTPLYIAAQNGHLEIVDLLIQRKASVDKATAIKARPIFVAAQNGHVEIVALLLKMNAKVDVSDADGATPLHIAAENGHVEVVAVLLNHHADLDASTVIGKTPLFAAASSGHARVVALLLQSNARADIVADYGISPLYAAAQNGHVEVVTLLLESNANVDMAVDIGASPLWIAARLGRVEVVATLLASEAKSDMPIATGVTPLFIAAAHGHLEVARLLLQKNVDVNATDEVGATPLSVAAENNHVTLVALLIKHHACVDMANVNGETPLFCAARNGHDLAVIVLLLNKANVDFSNVNGDTPLIIASRNGHLDAIALLLQFNATVDMANVNGETPLFCAAQNGHTDVVTLLLQHNANVDIADALEATPLLIAAKNGHVDVVAELLMKNAKVGMAGTNGVTPLHVASQEGHTQLVDMFLTKGVQPDAPDAQGNTPLIAASRNGHLHAVQALLERNASLHARNAAGETALLAAGASRHFDVVDILTQAGAFVHVRAANGDTLLICAAKYGDSNSIAMLVERGYASLDCASNSQGSCVMATLQTLQDYCKETHEFRAIWESVVHRLTDMYAQFPKGEELSRSVNIEYLKIISRLVRLKPICATGSIYSRLVASRSIANRFHDIHAEMTYLQRRTKVNQGDPMHAEWLSRYEMDQENLLDTFQDAINDDTNLLSSRQNETDHAEAISLLQHEVDMHSDKCSPAMLTLLQCSVAELLQASPDKVDPIPAWFINTHELDINQLGNSESSQTRRGIRAHWLSSKVLVSEFQVVRGNFIDDVERWVYLSHPNVVTLFGASHLQLPYVAVFENVSHTNLREFDSADKNRQSLWRKLHEAALGLKYLQSRGIILDFLNCEHVWVGRDGCAKLNAFGIGVSPEQSVDASHGVRWRSPECMRGDKPSLASNVFSFGMCIFEAVTRNVPWTGENDYQVATNVTRGYRPKFAKKISDPKRDLIHGMWSSDPSKRMGLATVIEHLNRFAEDESQSKGSKETNVVETIDGNRSYDLEGYVVPELASSIQDFLGKLERRCSECRDSHDSVLHVYNRLRDVYSLLRQAGKLSNAFEVVKYCQVLLRLDRFLRTATEAISLLQRAKSRAVCLQSNAFHREIDDLLDLLSVPSNIDSVHNWKQQIAARDTDIDRLNGEIARLQKEGKPKSDPPRVVKIVRFDSDTLNQKFQNVNVDTIDSSLQDNTKRPPWFIPIHKLKVNRDDPIGTGAFGEVFKAKWNGTPVVVKSMGYEADEDECARELFFHELRVWYPLSHSHVVKLFGACHVGKRHFACEYAGNGTLDTFLKRDKNADKKWKMLHQVALGLQYLHELNIIHNDLKCDNILVGADGNAKITDFGLSCIPNSAEVKVDKKQMGAIRWKSPEYLRGERLTVASDIYSFGMCILEAVSGELPWRDIKGDLDAVVRFRVLRGNLPLRLESMSDSEWALVEMMCASKASERIEISLVVEKLDEFSQQEDAMKESRPSCPPNDAP